MNRNDLLKKLESLRAQIALQCDFEASAVLRAAYFYIENNPPLHSWEPGFTVKKKLVSDYSPDNELTLKVDKQGDINISMKDTDGYGVRISNHGTQIPYVVKKALRILIATIPEQGGSE